MYPYQHRSVKHVLDNPRCGLLLDMGLGKTVSTLTAIAELMDALEVERVLIIAPKRVAETVWPREVHVWEHLTGLRVEVASGTARQRMSALKSGADIVAVGVDNTAWLCAQYGGGSLPFDMVVIDELSCFKNAKSKRFKALRMAIANVPRVVGLTGTPAPNSLIDLWSQMYLLDGGQRLGRYITQFRSNYFKPDKSNGHVVYSYKTREGCEERIYSLIGDICLSMKSEDYLALPELRTIDVALDMPAALAERYKEFEKEKVLELFEDEEQGAPIAVTHAAALSNKLLQFANGAVYDELRNVKPVHELKLDALEDIIEQANGKPVLVAYTYQHDRDRIMRRLKGRDVRSIKDEGVVEEWNKGNVEVLLLHPASGGHGLNLQYGGNTAVWFGHTWSLELYQQLNKRLHRQGQTASVVNMYRIILKGSMDERVLAAQSDKAKGQDRLMDAVKEIVGKYK